MHLLDLQDGSCEQDEVDLDEAVEEGVEDRSGLMKTLDDLNDHDGRGTVSMPSSGTSRIRSRWVMKAERKNPGYTMSWADMPLVLA